MNTAVVDFLESMEESHPLGAHAKFYDAWANNIQSFAEEGGVLQTDGDRRTLSMLLDIRRLVHEASTGGSVVSGLTTMAAEVAEPLWHWLLTATQVEQRTPEWYQETRNMITASEVATVFKSGRTRGQLVMSKASPPAERFIASLAVPKASTGPMDWGVRYEPVVKEFLENSLKAKIHDLGRIRHRTNPKIAASPDGLIMASEKAPELAGRLVEIKCPSTRVIKDGEIPFEYWCQMQLQMEVCGVDACEFVEAKFVEELPSPAPSAPGAGAGAEAPGQTDPLATGFISLVNKDDVKKYIYHSTASASASAAASLALAEEWTLLETYPWYLMKLRRVTVPRDVNWFAQSQPAFEQFWTDVEGAKAGTWILPPGRTKVPRCQIADDSQ
jgi:putative phage-type endonuclease